MKKTESNEWVTLEGKVATVGITKHAAFELGEIVFIELPEIGKVVAKGDEAAILESTKAAADSYAPLTGKIIKINQKIVKDPSLVIRDPQGEGWLYQIEVHSSCEYDSLVDHS